MCQALATASVEAGHLGTSIERTIADVGLTELGSSNGNYQGAAVHVQ